MDETSWKHLRRCLLVFAPTLFLLSYVALELATKAQDYQVAGDFPNDPGITSQDELCASGSPIALSAPDDFTPADAVLLAVLVAVLVLDLLWLRWASTRKLRMTAVIILILVIIALVWLDIDAYIDLHNGLVWFAPRCPGGS